jgi:hypothetical protein
MQEYRTQVGAEDILYAETVREQTGKYDRR